MKNQEKMDQAREIDFNEVVWQLAYQWKAVFIVALIVAILLCGYKYKSDFQAYNNEIAVAEENEKLASLSGEERTNAVLETLPENERKTVKLIVNEKDWINNQEAYLNDSLIMNSDPSSQRTLSIIYDIEAEDSRKLSVLANSYSIHLYDDEIIKGLENAFGYEGESRYMDEALSVDVGDNTINDYATLYVKVILTDDAKEDVVENVITNHFLQYCKTQQDKYPHSIKMAACEVSNPYNEEHAFEKRSIINNINDSERFIKSTTPDLTEGQKAAINRIELLNRYAEGYDESEATISIRDSIARPTPNIKYGMAGGLLGIFIYSACFLLVIILKDEIFSSTNAKKVFRSRIIGTANCHSKKKLLDKLLTSRFVYNLRYRELDPEAQYKTIRDNIVAICKHENIDSITIIDMIGSDMNNEYVREVIQRLNKDIVKSGIAACLLEKEDIERENEFIKMSNAIIVVDEQVKIKKANILSEILDIYKVNNKGIIYAASK